MKSTRGAIVAFGLAVLALASASCSHQIGDGCQTGSDCDPSGTRICDLAQPGGYCTVLGCDETTCPSEATCVRYFPVQYLSKACNPYCEDRTGLASPDGGSDGGLAPDAGLPLCPGAFPEDGGGQTPASEVCPNGATNDCTADEVCLDVGLCAPRSTEVRYCAKACGSNSDCRSGYVCQPTGIEGSVALSATTCRQTSFCSPAP